MSLISVILCTLGNRPKEMSRLLESLEEQTDQRFELIVVSQGNHDDIEGVLNSTTLNFRHYRSEKKGLSLARNIGLSNAKGDIITVSDDDCWYPNVAFERVFEIFDDYGDKYQGFCLQVYDPDSEQYYKTYDFREYRITRSTVGKCSSIEIFYRRDQNSSSVFFDEEFGLGAKYPSSEENIFLSDLLKKGCKLLYYPEIIVFHRKKDRKAIKFTDLRIKTARKMFNRIYGVFLGPLAYYAFILKHHKKIENKIGAFFGL